MKIKFDMKQSIEGQFRANGLTYDAGETAAFARELEVIQAEAVEALYPEYKFDKLVPIKSDAPDGATAHTWREIEGFGEAEFLESLAPEDFPTTDVQGKENTGKFRSLGVKYMYSIDEIARAALMSNFKPEVQRNKLAKQVVDSRFDISVFNGGGGFTGLGQDASSQDDTAAIAAAVTGGSNWNTATPDTVVAAIKKQRDIAFVASNGLFEEFDFVFTPKLWTKLGTRLDTYSDKTIADFVLSSVPGVRSLSWTGRLAAKGAGGIERSLCYPRDPRVLEAYIPVRFRQMPPQLRGMVFEIYCQARYGGLRFYHPNMIRRHDITCS